MGLAYALYYKFSLQARYLLDMLCPCTPTSSLPSNGEKPPPLHTMESTSAVAHVLKVYTHLMSAERCDDSNGQSDWLFLKA